MLVSLTPISEDTFVYYLEQAIPYYAQVKIAAGKKVWRITTIKTES